MENNNTVLINDGIPQGERLVKLNRIAIQQMQVLERNVWPGNDEGIHKCQQFVINYEDSIRRRYEMMQDAVMRDSIGRLIVYQSEHIREMLK